MISYRDAGSSATFSSFAALRRVRQELRGASAGGNKTRSYPGKGRRFREPSISSMKGRQHNTRNDQELA
jgi:hypothetical protein